MRDLKLVKLHLVILYTIVCVFGVFSSSIKTGVEVSASHLCPDYEISQVDKGEPLEDFIADMEQSFQTSGTLSSDNYPPLFSQFRPLNGDLIGTSTWRVSSNSAVKIRYQVYYSPEFKTLERLNIRYFALLNEQPVNFVGSKQNLLYQEINLHPGEGTELVLELPSPLTSGINDLIVIGIPNAYENPRSATYYDSLSYIARTTLVTEDTEGLEPAVARSYQHLPAAGTNILGFGEPFQRLTLSLTDALTVWNYPDSSVKLERGENLKFNILTGYLGTGLPDNPRVDRSALFLLVDYQLTPIDNADVMYIELDNTTAYARIPVELTASLALDRQDIVAVRIQNPGLPICKSLVPNNDGSLSDIGAVETMRVVVDIED
jgi:hypothetical protein